MKKFYKKKHLTRENVERASRIRIHTNSTIKFDFIFIFYVDLGALVNFLTLNYLNLSSFLIMDDFSPNPFVHIPAFTRNDYLIVSINFCHFLIYYLILSYIFICRNISLSSL